MSGRGPRGRFAIPDELLRLAEAEAAPTSSAPAPSPPFVELPPGPAVSAQLLTHAAGLAVAVTVGVAARGAVPHAQRALHVGDAGVQALLVAAVAAGLAAGPMVGRIADRVGRVRVGTIALGVVTLGGMLAAVAPSVSVLAALLVIVAAAAGLLIVADLPTVVSSADPGATTRALAWYSAALPVSAVVGVALTAALVSLGGWRVSILVSLLGVPALAVRARVLSRDVPNREVTVGATAQRVKRLRSYLTLVVAASVLAFGVIGAPIITANFLQHRWHESFAGRGDTLARVAFGLIVGVPIAGLLGDRAWARRRLMTLVGAGLAAFGILTLVAGFLPLGAAEVAWALSVAALTVVAIAGTRGALAVSDRAAASTTLGLLMAYGLVFGGFGATIVANAVAQSTGARSGLVFAGLGIIGAGGFALVSEQRFEGDVAARALADEGVPKPRAAALDVRNVDFSYGARQVLFRVSFAIEDGEVAALLGTNGAGKSTLLRLIAGLDHPSSGAIRLSGRDTTYIEAEQQIGNGIAMLPGGRMSFPSLTVMENLRVGGHSIRRDGARLQSAIDEVMHLFPVLAERREQRVGTLSGGEQQMLALGRVLLTRPRLLLIDELSLGLAPKAVEALLAIVRRVNEDGTTVLLVEQSVNLALALAAHALFLERGEVRFDGNTKDLLRRDDLLRPIFLTPGV